MSTEAVEPDVEIPNVAISDFVLENAAEFGDKPALIDGPSGRQITYAELAQGVRALASGLASRGFSKGDVLAVYMPNVPEYAIAFHGAASAGGKCTTVNPLYTANELDPPAQGLRRPLPAHRAALPRARRARRPSAPASRRSSCSARARGQRRSPSCSATPSQAPEAGNRPGQRPRGPALLERHHGLPKGVMLTHRNLVANLCQIDARPSRSTTTTRSSASCPSSTSTG